jgi:hypothetical protein
MKVGLCKMCAREGALAKAHIVPKAFYNILPQEPLMLFSGKKDSRPKRIPSGIYDENLLCEGCEKTFSHLDSEAVRILKPWPRRPQLLKDEHGFIIKLEGKKAGYSIQAPDPNALLPFFHFLLWRMAETSRPELRLKLDTTLTERLRLSLLSQSPDGMGLRIYGTRSSELAAQMVANPRIGQIEGAAVINLDFYGYQFKLKFVDDGIDEFVLTKDRDWPILFEDFRATKLYASMRPIAQKTPNPWARLQAQRKKRTSNG